MNEPLVTVEIFDTTLRDGAQSLPAENQFPDGSKGFIAGRLAALGIGVIEAGFPRTPGDGEEVAEVARTVGQSLVEVRSWVVDGKKSDHTVQHRVPIIAGLSRTTPEDIEATWSAVHDAARPRIHTFVSTDDEHMRAKFPGKSPDDVMAMGRRAVRHAKQLSVGNKQATVEFSAEAATTTQSSYLEAVIKAALDEGADVINLPDTVGQRDPIWMMNFYRQAIRWVHAINPDATISAHNHNDLGLAVANSFSLVRAAAEVAAETDKTVNTQIETTICGLGERAGNADVFPVVAGLFKFSEDLSVPVKWEFNPDVSVQIAQTVMGAAALSVDRQNPVVGHDIMAHRSGIHSDGVIKGGFRIYTPLDPTFWGHDSTERHEEGKYQGTRGRAAASSMTKA